MALTAAVVGVGLLGTGASMYQSNQANQQAQSQMAQQNDTQNKQLKQAQDAETNSEATNNADSVRDSQRMKLQMLAGANQGRQGTIMTSPLGVGGAPGAGGATSKPLGA